jgi:hypothetical protein
MLTNQPARADTPASPPDPAQAEPGARSTGDPTPVSDGLMGPAGLCQDTRVCRGCGVDLPKRRNKGRAKQRTYCSWECWRFHVDRLEAVVAMAFEHIKRLQGQIVSVPFVSPSCPEGDKWGTTTITTNAGYVTGSTVAGYVPDIVSGL